MSRSLNKALLIGNVGSDPEVRSTTSGGRVATLSIATSTSWTNQAGEKQEKTQWHKCVVWNKKSGGGLVDVVEKYVRKGDRLYIEGEIEYRNWQDKDGQTKYTTEINVRDLVMLGGKTEAAARPASTKAAAGALSRSSDFEDFDPHSLDEDDDELGLLPF